MKGIISVFSFLICFTATSFSQTVSTNTLMQKAKDAFNPEDPDLTIVYADSVISIASKQQDYLKLYDAYVTKGYCAQYQQDFQKLYLNLESATSYLNIANELLSTDSFQIELNRMWGDYYFYIGNNYLSKSHFSNTINQLKKREELSAWERQEMLSAYQGMKRIHELNGKLEAALEAQEFIVSRTKSHSSTFNLARSFFIMDDFANAIHHYELSLPFIEKKYYNLKDYPLKQSTYGNYLVLSYSNLGASFSEVNNEQKATEAFTKARTFKTTDNHYKIKLFLKEANTYAVFGQNEKARQLISEVESLANHSSDEGNPDATETWIALGDFYLDQDEPGTALTHFQSGIINSVTDFNEISIDKNPVLKNISSKNLLLGCLRRKVTALEKLANQSGDETNKQLAWETGELALDLIQNSLQEVDLLNSDLINIVAENYSLFESMVSIGYDLGCHEDVFPIIEQSKSFALLKTLKESDALQQANIPDTLSNKFSLINFEITNMENDLFAAQMDESQDTKLIADLEHEIYQKKQERILIKVELAQYTRFEDKVHDFQEVTSVQESLDANEGVLSYFIGDKTSYAFLVKKDSRRIKQLNLTPALLEKAATLKEDIFEMRDSMYVAHAYELWKHLIQPFEEYDLPNRLIVMPDGPLYYLPFEALLTERVAKKDSDKFTKHKYLLRDHAISYCFSSTLLDQLENKTHSIEPIFELLGIAPSFKSTSTPVKSVATVREGLSELEHNESEVQGIFRYMDSDKLLGAYATKDTFVDLAQKYRYLHLATHAQVNDSFPEFSFVAFTNLHESDEQKYKLYSNELAGLKLNADMVVLSACETGVGEVFKGEGMISIARGFIAAGTKSIVTTLWNIDDQKTATLMQFFYENLNEGLTKDVALQKAKKEYLESEKEEEFNLHPRFWAAFVPYGDMENIKPRFSIASILTPINIISGLIASCIFWFFFILRRKKKEQNQLSTIRN